MSKHTKGPWRYVLGSPNLVEDSMGQWNIARVENSDDAKLIAEAPTMLELLKKVKLELVSSGFTVEASRIVDAIDELEKRLARGDLWLIY